MLNTFLSSLGSKFLLTLLLTSTVLTTGVAISKVSSSFTASEIPNKGINIQAAENEVEPTGVVERTVSPIIRTITRIPSIAKALVTPTPFPVAVVPTKAVTAATNSQCIITLLGVQYDVSKLRSTHSGGDVFKCGTDMTSVYQARHGTDMSRMQAYLVGSTQNTNGSPTAQPTSTMQKTEERDNEREDKDHEDRYIKVEKHEDKQEDND